MNQLQKVKKLGLNCIIPIVQEVTSPDFLRQNPESTRKTISGGVSQKVSQVIKPGIGRCIACSSLADLVECEKVLKVFFVPVWRWKGKDSGPVMHCDNCGLFFPPMGGVSGGELRCESCLREVDSGFKFCPFCGSQL